MEKLDMREWVISLEEMLNNKLKKWDKHKKWENGAVVYLMWQWEGTLIKFDIFWHDEKEKVRLRFVGPYDSHDYFWDGLTKRTYNRIQDRVGNIAQAIMNPCIDPEFDA